MTTHDTADREVTAGELSEVLGVSLNAIHALVEPVRVDETGTWYTLRSVRSQLALGGDAA